jgi:hypothetical protein
MKKRTIVISVLSAIVIIAGALHFLYMRDPRTNACSLPDYTAYHGYPEDLLILEGRCVVPTAIEAIKDRALPKRPNIISFLGNGRHEEALNPLVTMVEDETEPDRDFAIIAVFRIDQEKGRDLARKYQGEKGELGKCSRDILEDRAYLHDHKTYLEALRSYIEITYAL